MLAMCRLLPAFLLCVTSFATVARAEPPLVPSGAFATPFSLLSWHPNEDPDQTFEWSEEDVDDSLVSGSLRITTNDTAPYASAFSTCRQVRPGLTLEFSAWHSTPVAADGAALLSLSWNEFCPHGSVVGSSSSTESTSVGQWTLIAGTATAPPEAGGVKLVLNALKLSGASAPYVAYFDDVRLPEPAHGALAALAALGLLARRRYA